MEVGYYVDVYIVEQAVVAKNLKSYTVNYKEDEDCSHSSEYPSCFKKLQSFIFFAIAFYRKRIHHNIIKLNSHIESVLLLISANSTLSIFFDPLIESSST